MSEHEGLQHAYRRGAGGGGGDGEGGRRSRKPVVRKTVDCHSSIITHLQSRFYSPPILPTPFLPPSVDAVPFLTTTTPTYSPIHPLPSPAHSFTTRYITQSINKQRTSILTCAFTPDHKRVITGAASGELTLWNALTFNFETILQGHDDAVRCLAWGGEGSSGVLATGDDSGVIKFWQVSMNNLKALKAHKSVVREVSFSPASGGSKLASCSDDHTVSVWDVEYSKEDVGIAGHGWDVKTCHWHPYLALLVTGSKDNSVRMWDPRTGREEFTLHGHKNTVNTVRWNTNGHWLCSGGRDRVIKVWDWRMSRELSTHRVSDKEVTCAAWHPCEESVLCSGSYDGDVKFWRVGEEELAAEISSAHDKEVNGLAFHPLGHLLVSVSSDQLTRYWARNKPGDEMTDKYNVRGLGGGRRVEALMELQEAQRMNPMARGGRGMMTEPVDVGWGGGMGGGRGGEGMGGGGYGGGSSVPLGFAEAGRAIVEERERAGRERAEERKRDWERDRERVDRERNAAAAVQAMPSAPLPPPPPPPPAMSARERFERQIAEQERRKAMQGGGGVPGSYDRGRR